MIEDISYVLKYTNGEPFVVISISTPLYNNSEIFINRLAKVPVEANQVLYIQIEDIDKPYQYKKKDGTIVEGRVINEDIARQIAGFAKEHEDKIVICQCEAGISRSAGVAAALSKYFNNDDSEYFGDYVYCMYDPNRRVYRMVLEACVELFGVPK
jgi:predicted protein tyrosine phosphatase